MIELIAHNPFRILGVFANASKREILSSKSKLFAFAKIGKSIECPSDFCNILGEVVRTTESIEKAESQVTLSEDKIRSSLFWFWSLTPVDKIGFNHLRSGDIDQALSIWSKVDNISSLQNSILCLLLQDKVGVALSVAESFYSRYVLDICSLLNETSNTVTSDELMRIFVKCLNSEFPQKLQDAYREVQSTSLKSLLKSELLEPLLALLRKDIVVCNNTRGQNSQVRLEAAIKLMNVSQSLIKKIGLYEGENGTQMNLLADKLSEEILMGAIDYYNKTNDHDAPRKALPIMEYAQMVARGDMQIERCKSNIATVKEALDSLPPDIIADELKHIYELIGKFEYGLSKANNPFKDQNSFTQRLGAEITFSFAGKKSLLGLNLLKDVRPYIASIRLKIGRTEQTYINVSTLIVNSVLKGIIEDVNEYWVDDKISLLQNPSYRLTAVAAYKQIFLNSWQAVLYMNLLDMSQECRENRFAKNKAILLKILNSIDAFKRPFEPSNSFLKGIAYGLYVTPFYYYPDDHFFESCRTLVDYSEYMKIFPKGKHFEEAKAQYLIKKAEHSLRNNQSSTSKTSYNRIKKPETKTNKVGNKKEGQKKKNNSWLIFFGFLGMIMLAIMYSLIHYGYQADNKVINNPTNTEVDDTLASDTASEYYNDGNDDNSYGSEDYTETQYNNGDAPYGKGIYQKGSLATFTIDNPTSNDAVVILVNSKGKWIRNAYVKAGSKFKMTKIPECVFIIKVMQGLSWNADKDNGEGNPRGGFMKNVAYSQSSWDESFDYSFTRTSKYISYPSAGVTLESTDGNMEKEDITSNDFFN